MEKLYLEKIRELLSSNNTSLKDEILKLIQTEFKKLEKPIEESYNVII